MGPDRTAVEAVKLAGFSIVGRSAEEQNLLFTRYWLLGDDLTGRIRALIDLGTRWKPDPIVRGEVEFGGCVAAERLGVPHASIKAYPNIDGRELPGRPELLAERLGILRGQVGVPPDPIMPYRNLEIWPFPTSFRDRPYPSPTCRPARPIPFDQSGSEGLPVWIDDLPPRDQLPRVLWIVAKVD